MSWTKYIIINILPIPDYTMLDINFTWRRRRRQRRFIHIRYESFEISHPFTHSLFYWCTINLMDYSSAYISILIMGFPFHPIHGLKTVVIVCVYIARIVFHVIHRSRTHTLCKCSITPNFVCFDDQYFCPWLNHQCWFNITQLEYITFNIHIHIQCMNLVWIQWKLANKRFISNAHMLLRVNLTPSQTRKPVYSQYVL